MQLDLPYVLMPGSLLHGSHLQCRLPTSTLSLRAPARILRALYEFDGTLTPRLWLQRRARENWDPEVATDFLDALIAQGALASVADAPRHWWAYAENPRKLGEPPDGQTLRQLVQSAQHRLTAPPDAGATTLDSGDHATPLHALLARRASRREFGDTAMDAHMLTSILWSAAGIIGSADGTRTTSPSAGALYPLQYLYINLRATGTLGRGTYRLVAGYAGQLHFVPIAADLSCLYAAFSAPWLLERAQGVLVIAADFSLSASKYGPRALSYVPLEAGHAAQNALLAAAACDCHAVEIGGFVEAELGQLLRLADGVVPVTTVFLGSATADADTPLQGEFDWIALSPPGQAHGFHLCRARLDASHPWSWGRDPHPAMARLKATMESRERAALLQPRHLIRALHRDLPTAVDPADILRYRPRQYRQAGFPYRPLDDSAAYWWKAAHDVFAGTPCFVLADLVYLEEAFAGWRRPPAYTSANTSGVASHTSTEAALENAVLELIERDAFMRLWLGQPAHIVAEDQLPDALQGRLARMRSDGLRVEVRSIGSPYCRVAFCYAQSPTRHFTRVAACANYDLHAALDHALMELEAQVYISLHQSAPAPLHPAEVKEASDHARLYGQKSYFRRADHLAAQPLPVPPDVGGAHDWHGLLDRLRHDGQRLIAVDLSDGAPDATPTMRAFIPGLIPLKFGAGNAAEGHPAYRRASRVATASRRHAFPHPFN